jgi:predicted deacylase
VVGGVQGDEPGGFSAAALLISHYKITSGAVWVVPNLNFLSIIRCSRGVYGDMNRKFAALDPGAPEYAAVPNIKKIITDPRVAAVRHLPAGWVLTARPRVRRLAPALGPVGIIAGHP